MKTNGERKHGGSLKQEYYGAWAEYISRYIKEYRDRGYVWSAVFPFRNEPKAVQTPGFLCLYGRRGKTVPAGPSVPGFAEERSGDIKIFIWDHNKERVFERACAFD